MYKNVRELRQEEINELKQKIIIDRDNDYDFFCYVMGNDKAKEEEGLSNLTSEEWELINNAEIEDDIPTELIYKIYDDTLFVEEDFWCNTEGEE